MDDELYHDYATITEEEMKAARPMEGYNVYQGDFKRCVNELIQALRMKKNVYLEWTANDGSTVKLYSFGLYPFPQKANEVYEKAFGKKAEFKASDFWLDENSEYTIESDIDLGKRILKEQLLGQGEKSSKEAEEERRKNASETAKKWEKYVRENMPLSSTREDTLKVMLELQKGTPLREILKMDLAIDGEAIKQFGGEKGKRFVELFMENRLQPEGKYLVDEFMDRKKDFNSTPTPEEKKEYEEFEKSVGSIVNERRESEVVGTAKGLQELETNRNIDDEKIKEDGMSEK